ncbi:hypothetical protein FKM82_030325, partial [Ascaphus truei]
DAKRMSVKEEKYDPGYDTAFGENLTEQTSAGESGSNFPSEAAAPSNPEFSEGSIFGQGQNGQWMPQPFTEQMSTFNHCEGQQQEGSSA